MRRLNITLHDRAWDALADAAIRERRSVKEHAAWVVEQNVLRKAEKEAAKAVPVPA